MPENPTPNPRLSGERGEQLCNLGIDCVEMYSREGYSAADLAMLSEPADAIEGLILLAQCLQAMWTVQSAAQGWPIDTGSILVKARESAALWRANRTGGAG